MDVDTDTLIYLINTINSSFVEYFTKYRDLGFNNEDLIIYLDHMLFILNNGLSPTK
jgi:hypothetical protein